MVKHIQDPKTGKLAGSIGDGKTKTPQTGVPHPKVIKKNIASEETNPFFEGKPSWFPGYAKTIAEYVTHNDTVSVPGQTYMRQPSPLAKHLTDDNCEIKTIHDVNEHVDVGSFYNSWGDAETEAYCSTSASVTCACGKYVKYQALANDTLESTMSNAFRWARNREAQAVKETAV